MIISMEQRNFQWGNSETHYKWPFSIALSNYHRVTPVSGEPFIAPLIRSRCLPSSQLVNQQIFQNSHGCWPYYLIKWIIIAFNSNEMTIDSIKSEKNMNAIRFHENPMDFPSKQVQVSMAASTKASSFHSSWDANGRTEVSCGVHNKPSKKIGVQAHSLNHVI